MIWVSRWAPPVPPLHHSLHSHCTGVEVRLGCYYFISLFLFRIPCHTLFVSKESFLHLLTHGCARSFKAWRLCHIGWRLLRPRGCNRNSNVSEREKETKGTVFQFSRFGLALSLGLVLFTSTDLKLLSLNDIRADTTYIFVNPLTFIQCRSVTQSHTPCIRICICIRI